MHAFPECDYWEKPEQKYKKHVLFSNCGKYAAGAGERIAAREDDDPHAGRVA
jgi:hypothetical protein